MTYFEAYCSKDIGVSCLQLCGWSVALNVLVLIGGRYLDDIGTYYSTLTYQVLLWIQGY